MDDDDDNKFKKLIMKNAGFRKLPTFLIIFLLLTFGHHRSHNKEEKGMIGDDVQNKKWKENKRMLREDRESVSQEI